ncbi:hypothetical protein [Mesorhizobium sp. KR1-2]|uniref:hypothetical protein n=1 Tax=Mesorhizobium sp. KR1-2 TaxID=3156609 RepID=UPI0032B3BD79
MPDLARFTDFASRVGAVAPACSTCSTVAPAEVIQDLDCKNNAVALVAPVAPRNDDDWRESDLLDAYEERAAIMEYDGGLPRYEAEALAWKEVFGDRAKAA